jgi:plastocyanin
MGAAAIVELVLLAVAGASLTDAEALAFAVIVAGTTAWFFWRPGRVAILIRSLVFLDVLFFMGTATVANLSTHESLSATVLPLALAVASATGLVATTGYLIRGAAPRAGGTKPTVVAAAAVALFVTGVGVTVTAGAGDPQLAHGGDLKLSAHSAKFSTTTLKASPGQVAIYMTNDDLFWHTVTIKELGVDVRIPVKGHRRITFSAAPGTYTFYCAIPGHAGIGMKGTLTVR